MKRATLADFAPQKAQPDGGRVLESVLAPAPAKTKKPAIVSVYLTPEEVRTLKLIGIEHNRKLTDICATAVREWLERNGHARGKMFKA